MHFTIKGFGIALFGNAKAIHWTKKAWLNSEVPDHDAIQYFVALRYFPLIPLRAFHTFGWHGEDQQTIRIRFSASLLLHVYLRVAAFLLTVIGSVAAVMCLFGVVALPDITMLAPAALGVTAALLGIVIVYGVARLEQRSRDVRLVLGPHLRGSSDPATWMPALLEEAAPNPDLAAGWSALHAERWSEAMFVARAAVGRGESEGERLTDAILAIPTVQSVLVRLRKRPWKRNKLLPTRT